MAQKNSEKYNQLTKYWETPKKENFMINMEWKAFNNCLNKDKAQWIYLRCLLVVLVIDKQVNRRQKALEKRSILPLKMPITVIC